MPDPINPMDVNQTDYMKLFMQELTYQDPLKPVDNREFMAQMAQFSALQQATESNEHLKSLLAMTSSSQGIALLGKEVKIKDSEHYGTVTSVKFYDNKPTQILVSTDKVGIFEVDLQQVTEIREKFK